MLTQKRNFSFIAVLLWCLILTPSSWGEEGRKIDFNRDVRPILSAKCYACHGPDKPKRKAKLRLDTKEGLFGDRGGYAVVVPGKPGDGELIDRISSSEEDYKMPPQESLTQKEVETLKAWITQGAKWTGHWSYIPVSKPDVPEITDAGGKVYNEIDSFILKKIQETELKQSSFANPITLMRRVSFDLTGLPPKQEDVETFLKQSASEKERQQAFEAYVDSLLNSSAYGERMAMYWLDLVRYADTNGYHGDNHRDIWLYRDYVINSFNQNKPFDQFTKEQLAGDLLPNRTSKQLVASGYNRLLMTTREGGAQAKEYLAKYTADRVRNVSTVWLATTMGCAECHNHKFDPFTMKDFYSLGAFFADIQETAVGKQGGTRIPSPEDEVEIQKFNDQIAGLKKTLDTQTPELTEDLKKWESDYQSQSSVWSVITPASVSAKEGTTLKVQKDGSVLASGKNPDKETYQLSFSLDADKLTGLRLEVLPHPSFPAKGPGRAGNGNFVINQLTAHWKGKPIPFTSAQATHSQSGWNIAGTIDGKPNTGWAILKETGKPNSAVFTLKTPLTAEVKGNLDIQMTFLHGQRHALGHFRFSATETASPLPLGEKQKPPANILEILKVKPEGRTAAQQKQLSDWYRTIAPRLASVRKQLADMEQKKKNFENAIPTTLVSTSVKPRTMRILPRGNWLDDSGPVVNPAFPELLKLPVKAKELNRLELANWMVNPQNPLVARVFVNRLWKMTFGRGLVSSMDDFGAQGMFPTHPELLDWLAAEFIESGWDIKQILRLMILSATYQQSSIESEAHRKHDPANTLFTRQNRFRLEAEMVRDQALVVSGLLVNKVGGQSVKPYQPSGYWRHLNFPRRTWTPDQGESQYRRGLYTYWCRTFLHPSMLAFDASTREECVVERPRSNTPLQALTLLNDPSYLEAAKSLAEHIMTEGGQSSAEKLKYAFQKVLTRSPRPEELKVLEELFAHHLKEFQSDEKSAQELLSIGLKKPNPALDTKEFAAWLSVCRVLLNLHETIMRY